MSNVTTRRHLLKTASLALAAIPLAVITRATNAAANAALRAQFQYQDSPKGEMNCASCLEFVPGKTEKDLGGCKKIPGDSEISPNGYCTLWNTM